MRNGNITNANKNYYHSYLIMVDPNQEMRSKQRINF